MEIISLVGKSGTGKSFQAGGLCSNLGIDGIIDDGLFIMKGQILAGQSAKRQDTKIRAIKTALFIDDMQRDEVVQKIAQTDPASILILGTSDKMINQITARLGLPQPSRRIEIEYLTTDAERRYARRQRDELGQHIIPVPTFQVKKDFSGYFIHPIRTYKDLRDDLIDGLGGRNPFGERAAADRPFAEKSVVRPTYSYLGKYTISDKAFRDIVEICARKIPAIKSVDLIFVKNRSDGVSIDVGLTILYGTLITDVAHMLQKLIAENVEGITSINILSVDIEVQKLLWENSGRKPGIKTVG
ncbi:MAG: Asp23/Gls24 family envelope stress response protein [Clostridiales Family XIII bacterium]|jgi:uncharacterized alkaline shock family protein YloU/adenylate kinase family enzyme|nr:Asp23/Gls24 family envelope stress response protein [Clostridiales Family XIII bacterium]